MDGLQNMFEPNAIKKPVKKESDNATQKTDAAAEIQENATQNKASKPALGRPRTKTEDEKIINIAVPLSVYKKINVAKIQYNNNLTLYINSLIERDLNENLEKYKADLLDI